MAHRGGERRRGHDRRRGGRQPVTHQGWAGLRIPSRSEQSVQFLTRFLFELLGLAFFNYAIDSPPLWFELSAINLAYAVHICLNGLLFLHMLKRPAAAWRFRLGMWADVLLVSLSVLCDPNAIPPSLLAFIMVVLGNGMRYGLGMFGEAVTACLGGAMLALSLRFFELGGQLNGGLLFLNLFGGIILVYAYILMSRIEASREQLERTSRFDPLTGLYNRRALFELAEAAFARLQREGGTLSVLFADMDRFKQVNDSYGHATGDRVLEQFGQILSASVRDYDIAARFGGDEFVLVLPGADAAQARQVAERIQRSIEAWVREAGLDCSLSIGIGEAPAQGENLQALLHQVDAAMYASKSSRRQGGLRELERQPA